MTPKALDTGTVALLAFALHGNRFAVPGRCVHEVVRSVAVAPLPGAPEVVEGVINYRGRLVPVLDVRSRFGFPPRPLDPTQHFVLADAGPRLVALRVDRALELLEVPAGDIESAASVAPGTRHAGGVARLPDGLVVIHDLERFLSLDEGEALDASLGERASRESERDENPE